MTTMIEVPRHTIEAIVRDELEFLIDYEHKTAEPDHNLIAALVTVLEQFKPIGELHA